MREHGEPVGNDDGARRRLWVAAAVAGAALQVTVGFFTMTAVGLIGVPLWAAVVLVGTWVAAAVLLGRTVRHAPLAAVLVPLANALVLWGVVAAGAAMWGWSG